ncbi:hypothetical protein ACA910_013698 [Epithemia clementina (nom. ined.)]
MSMKLRDLIRKVRQCKTASEERAVIAKESAMIRTAIREEQVHYRHRNVAKLLFMHMLGYPTHFGQLECMKLTASPHFPEKRIGYLGMLLLLSEEAEVLMLATNALKSDLVSDNKFVAGLALCAIGNLATADMSRDLAPEVDKHLKSPLAYLRKKACLAMARCLTKCPDMVEDFVDRVTSLLQDKSHGVLVTVVQLMTQVLLIDFQNAHEQAQEDDEHGGGERPDPYDTECRRAFLKLVPTLTKMLRNLLGTSSGGSGFMMENEVSGISDPFLQVQLLTLLRLLGTNNVAASEEMNDVLAQVATNTESAKNAGNAILYECVLTIMGIESEDGLRVLAINILGRFLLNRDNNIRYVALNTLAKCIVEQKRGAGGGGNNALFLDNGGAGTNVNNAMSALQRHRTTVVDCLKDPDVSIRQRALELIYHLVNADNVQPLVGELLNYLVLCPREHRGDIARRILKVVDRYTPEGTEETSQLWRVDTLITTLTIAGREASREVPSATAVYISRSVPSLHAFATHKLVKAIRDDDGSQHGLLAVGIWCIGEYGDYLLQPYTYTPSSTSTMNGDNGNTTAEAPITFMALEPLAIVDTIARVTKRVSCPEYIKERALTAYAKIHHRFLELKDSNPSIPMALQKLQTLLQNEGGSKSLELQLRACEYNALVHASQGLPLPKVIRPTATESDKENDSKSIMETDLFGVMDSTTAMTNGGGGTNAPPSSGVIAAAREALARMPVVDAKILQKRLMSNDEFSYGSSSADSVSGSGNATGSSGLLKPSAISSGGGGDLLDFGVDTTASTTTASTIAAAPAPSNTASDLELLADIFSAQPVTTTTTSTLQPQTSGGGMDLFGGPAPMSNSSSVGDIFGGTSSIASAPTSAPADIFGASSVASALSASSNLFGPAPTTAAPAPVNPLDLFGPSSSSTMPTTSTMAAPSNDMFGAPTPVSPPQQPASIKIKAIEFQGLVVEFQCTKPDTWNKQKSKLVAHFRNSNPEPLYGLNLQVAVPKFVTMEMEPATSTTIPPTAGGASTVTQTVNVTNSLLGTKNLVLKLKLGFSYKGQKQEHMATCSGFPPGEY